MAPLEDLIASARRGEEPAFEALVDRFRDMALGKAYVVLGDYHLAQDAVQDAFVEAFANLDKLREPAAFPGWFKRIVIKRIDRLIRGKKLPLATLDDGLQVAVDTEEAGVGIDREEVSDALRRAVAELPEHERGPAEAYYFEELPQQDVAAEFGVPVTTVKKRLYTSRQRLKETLADAGAIEIPEEADAARLPAAAQLFAAARNGYAAKAERLLRDDPKLVHLVNEDGLSILLYAAHASHHSGNRSVADLLIVRGAPLDVYSASALGITQVVHTHLRTQAGSLHHKGAWGRAPLHWAASGGHLELVEELIALGADVQEGDRFGCTPLHLAAELGHIETVRLLLENGAKTNARQRNGKTPLHVAAQGGNFGVVEELLRGDARIDVFAAASLGWQEVVQRMLSKDPFLAKARLPYGATPLHIAAEDGQLKMAEFLVERGSELDIVCAAELGWADEISRMLSEREDAVNAKSGSFGFTALHSATARGRRDLARLLLASGAEVNATDDMYHKTPLGEALYYGNEAMARLLFRHGAQA